MFGRITQLATAAIGLGYPAYASFQALETAKTDDDPQWLTYWVIYSVITVVESFLYFILTWIPFYDEIKLAFICWLALPHFNGAAIIYEKYIKETFNNRAKLVETVQANSQKLVQGLDPKNAGTYKDFLTQNGSKVFSQVKETLTSAKSSFSSQVSSATSAATAAATSATKS